MILKANKEVILSAGAIGTPQILQLSGIGDEKKLRSVGITPVVNLSEVGGNLADHPFLGLQWFVNSTQTEDNISRNATLAAELLAQWNASGTGIYANGAPPQLTWTRVANESTVFNGTVQDTSSGPISPHIEIITEVRSLFYSVCLSGAEVQQNEFLSFVQSAPATGNYITMIVAVVSPASRTYLRCQCLSRT